MIKRIFYTLLGAAIIAPLIFTQLVVQAEPITYVFPVLGPSKSADLVSINVHNLVINAGPGSAGVFINLPGNVATVPGGVIIQDDITLILTDVKVTYITNPNSRVELREQSQGLSVNNLLLDNSLQQGWHSVLGVKLTGNEPLSVGLAFSKRSNLDPDPIIDIELTGYVTTR